MIELMGMMTAGIIGATAEGGAALGDRRHPEEVPTPRSHQSIHGSGQNPPRTSPFGGNERMVPTPGTLALLGMAGLATVIRRRS